MSDGRRGGCREARGEDQLLVRRGIEVDQRVVGWCSCGA